MLKTQSYRLSKQQHKLQSIGKEFQNLITCKYVQINIANATNVFNQIHNWTSSKIGIANIYNYVDA